MISMNQLVLPKKRPVRKVYDGSMEKADNDFDESAVVSKPGRERSPLKRRKSIAPNAARPSADSV